jgi:basic membrane protein A and related proteins
MNDLSGHDIDRYHLIEKLGEGGMAVVYKAFDTHLECEVAVKLIRMDRLTPEMMETTLKRFEREAKSLAQLTHANIVKVTDYGEHDGVPYLVMEYLPGGTIKKYLGTPMPYAEAAKLLVPIARALNFAHEHKIIHRDVKPGNILITESGEPMLTDFGIAKILDLEEGQTLTGTGMGIGTPEYMSPEQWQGNITPAVDIYSLGVVFYELVTGHKPYSADTPAAVLLKSFNDPLPRPSSYVSGLPETVEQVLFKVLAKKPEDRYATMKEFEKALEGLAAGGSGAPVLNDHEKAADKKQEPAPILTDDKTIQKKVEPIPPLDFQPTLEIKKEPVKPIKHNKLPIWIGLGIVILAGVVLLVIKAPTWFSPAPAPTPTATPYQSHLIPTITSMPEVTATSVPVAASSKFLACEVTDTGGIKDSSFNEKVWNGIVLAENKLGISGNYLESKDPSDFQKNINSFIESRCDLIITVGYMLGDATKAAAVAHPEINFTIVDDSYDPALPNVVGQVYQSDEPSFLAGYLAAGMSKSGIVGTFGGINIPTVTIFMDGFARGVAYYNQVHGTKVQAIGWDTNSQTGLFTNDFNEPKIGTDMALTLLNKGADILFPVAGVDGTGAASAVQSSGNAYVIGVDDDWVLTLPDYQKFVLTSVMKQMDETTFLTINSAMTGTFKGGTTLGTLANGGVGLAPFHEAENLIPDSLKKELDNLKQNIIDGKVQMNPSYAH